MKRFTSNSVIVVAICSLALCVPLVCAADAPASPDLAQLEKRIADLEKQNKALADRVSALEKSAAIIPTQNSEVAIGTQPPTTGPAAMDIFDLANSVPAGVRPYYKDTPSETKTKQQLKDEWYKKEVVGKTVQLELEIDSISSVGVISGHTKANPINLMPTPISASCTPTSAFQLTALGLKKGERIIVVGNIKQAGPTDRFTNVTLSECTIK